MKKRILIITVFLALFAIAGNAQIVCHVEGEIMSNKYGDNIVICEQGTDLRVNDDTSLHVRAVNGKFTKTIECDHVTRYVAFLYGQYRNGAWRVAPFYAENGTVRLKLYADEDHFVESDGEQWLMQHHLDSLLNDKYGELNDVYNLYYDNERESQYYTSDYLNSRAKLYQEMNTASNQARVDSLYRVMHQISSNPNRFTPEGLDLYTKKKRLENERANYRYQYYADHPMLESLYETLEAINILHHSEIHTDIDPQPYERLIALYHDKLINYFPGHPIHEQIAISEAGYNLQPGKPYIDYNVRNTDGQLVPISSLINGKVALIDLWASWCGPCRRHSIAMIPIYEKYKDLGFTVVAIAREDSREKMDKAMKQDGYPWPSLLELKDENQVWRKNGADNSGGAMILVDRDGTILSTATDVKELEPLICKALGLE
jgi:thiol-disulfide isomerase/thioredoxin